MSMIPCRWFLWLGLAAAGAGCGDPDPDTTFVAQAAGLEVTVEEVAQLLAPAETRPDEREAALILANLWVDYVLLTTAWAEDSTFAHLELGPWAEQRVRLRGAAALRDSVVRTDATISEAELRVRYEGEAGGSELRARQILLAVPPYATQARQDSVLEAIQVLRTRIVEGSEDFEALAREHSQDRRTARRVATWGSSAGAK
jgi:hypothetical protein